MSLAQPPAALQPCVCGHAGQLPALRTTACLQLRSASNELVTGSWRSWGGDLSLRSSATSLALVPDSSSLDTLAERLRQLAVIGGGQSGNLSVHSFARSVVVVPDSSSLDTLAERLRRRPAKPMGSPRAGSNPTGVVCMHCCDAFSLPRSVRACAVCRKERTFFDHAVACQYCRCSATAYVSRQLS